MTDQEDELGATKRRCKELAEEVVQMQEELHDKTQDEHRQMRAWALDRAIETLKHNKETLTPSAAKSTAEDYVAWVLA